jgi:hypothetical protein
VVLSVVSGLSITAGVGSKEIEGDLLRAMAIPFGVLEGVIDAAEGGYRACDNCTASIMVW